MRVFVTGGTGFVGSHTARALIDAGYKVRLLVRSETKAEAVFKRLGVVVDDLVVGDVTDTSVVSQAVKGCDAVIHAAAMVSTAKKDADLVMQTNVGGTKTVINQSLAAGIKKIIYVSSVSALFNSRDTVMDENSPTSKATNPYGRSKVECENYIRDLQAGGAPISITYPTSVIGADDPALSEPHFGIKMFVGKFTFTSSSGLQFVNVRDIARAHVGILQNVEGPDRFMLGGHFYSWRELLHLTNKLTGRHIFSIHIPGWLLRFIGKCGDLFTQLTGLQQPMTGEGMVYASQWVYADSRKVERELGIQFTCHEKTLAETIRWLYQDGHLSAKKAGKLAS